MRFKSKFKDGGSLSAIDQNNSFDHPEFGNVTIDFHPLGLPVRHVITHGGRRAVGSFPSAKVGRTMPWESWIERELVRGLECETDVLGYLVQPFIMRWVCEGVPHIYVPEAIAETIDGISVFECKFEHPAVHGDEAANKYRMAGRICRHLGWNFQIVTSALLGRNPTKALNHKKLCDARFTEFDLAAELTVRDYLSSSGGSALLQSLVAAVARVLRISLHRAEAMVLAMAIRRIVRFDIEKRITPFSIVELISPRAPAMKILNFWEKANGKLAFFNGAAVEIDGAMYVYNMELPGGTSLFLHAKTGAQYQYVNAESGEKGLPTDLDLEALLAEGRLKPHFMAPAGNRNVSAEAIVDIDVEAIIRMDATARARREFLRLYDKTPCKLSDNALELFVLEHRDDFEAAGVEITQHASTLRRWIRARGYMGDRSLAAMVSMSGRVRRSRSFDPRTEEKIKERLSHYWLHEAVRECDVVDDVQGYVTDHNKIAPPHDKLKCPSDETIRQRLRKSETGELYKTKFGEKAYRIKYRTPCDRRLSAIKILETAVVDHTVVDTMLVVSAKHRTPLGRPTLALMVDVASRTVLAFFVTFEKPSNHTITRLLQRAARPKPHMRRRFPDFPDGAGIYGLPSSIVYDRALESIGVTHRDALADLGVEVVYAGAAQPQAKGIVERLFRTLNELLFHRLPGSVSLSASLMREMGYDPTKTAVVTLEELEELIEEAINVYHYQVHSSLDAQPIRIWTEQAERGLHTLADPSVLDEMIGVVKYPCTLDRAGVKAFRLQYCCEDNVPVLLDGMAAYQRTQRGKRKGSATAIVKIKYNPDDISRILVFNDKENRYYLLKCTDPDYASGISLAQHREILKYAKATNNRFCSPEKRREARLALTASIEASCPEITLKARRAQDKARNVQSDDGLFNEPLTDDITTDLGVEEIPRAVAANSRTDRGVPQSSPQRGKTARRRNAAKGKSNAPKAKPAAPEKPGTKPLVAVTETIRTVAENQWR